MDTFTFTDKDKHVTLTVKRKFLEVCPNPTEYNNHDLAIKFNVPFYLHNPKGPAVVDHYEKVTSYWLDGRIVRGSVEGKEVPIPQAEKEYEEIKFAESFKTDLDRIVDGNE